jgi:hypothetical protein
MPTMNRHNFFAPFFGLVVSAVLACSSPPARVDTYDFKPSQGDASVPPAPDSGSDGSPDIDADAASSAADAPFDAPLDEGVEAAHTGCQTSHGNWVGVNTCTGEAAPDEPGYQCTADGMWVPRNTDPSPCADYTKYGPGGDSDT